MGERGDYFKALWLSIVMLYHFKTVFPQMKSEVSEMALCGGGGI